MINAEAPGTTEERRKPERRKLVRRSFAAPMENTGMRRRACKEGGSPKTVVFTCWGPGGQFLSVLFSNSISTAVFVEVRA
jgi:hypothetical protein